MKKKKQQREEEEEELKVVAADWMRRGWKGFGGSRCGWVTRQSRNAELISG